MINKQLADDRTYDFLFRDALPSGDFITSFLAADSDVGLQFGTGFVNSTQVTYEDGAVYPVGTIIQLRVYGGYLPADMTQKLGKLRIRFSTDRDDVVEYVTDIVLRK